MKWKGPQARVEPSGYVRLYYASGRRRWQHRMVFIKKYGQGPYQCYWCGKVLYRMKGRRRHPDKMVVDHLNAIRHDNRIENLVAACNRCNVTRTPATLPFIARGIRGKPL